MGGLPTNNRFAIRVRRVDDIVDTTDGKLEAERTMQIFLMFDVSPTGLVTVNEAPVPLGISKLYIKAGMVVGVSEEAAKTLDKDELAKAFDVGLVNIVVHVSGEKIVKNGVEYNRIIIAERILEINGNKIEQNDIIQQVFTINDGKVSAEMPCHASKEVSKLLYETEVSSNDNYKIWAEWGLFAAKLSMLGMFAVGMILFHMVERRRKADDETNQGGYLDKVNLDSDSLPGYNAVPTQLPLDEKF
ncbi:hypothetical protein HK098_000176 [Nowakowskiella sp. JEL0407]|nr:hypothetical protein HK098_000176 [Nowakowskiella sp. JEL0407]